MLLPPRNALRGLIARIALFAAIFTVALVTTGATNAGERLNELGHKMICTCSCNQVLLECNHVGCQVSGGMIADLRAQISSGASDTSILNAFIAKYGPTVLSAPIRGGFDNVAWITPIAVFVLAIGGTALLIRRWRGRHLITPDGAPVAFSDTPADSSMRERIRRETDF